MRRERLRTSFETFELPPTLKKASFILAKSSSEDGDQKVLIVAVVIAVIFISLLLLTRNRRSNSDALSKLPWVGRDNRKWFAKLRTRTWTTVNYESALKEAYDTYSKNDQPCVLSALDGDTVVLQPSAISWLINLPDTVISTDESTKSVLQTRYSFTVPEIMNRTIHFDVIKGELTRQVFHLTDAVNDELRTAVDEIFGTDTENWRSIGLFDAITKVVARINNRVFVGMPLCRNEKYLKNAIGFAEDIALSATVLRLLPPWLRFFLAPIVTIPNKLHARGFTKMIKPEIARRQRLQSHDSEKEPVENDYLSWLLARSPPGFQSNPKTLIARMLHLNFASIHTTSFIGTNTLFDLLSSATLSQSKPSYIDQLLSELDSLGPLDRRALQKMHLMDACLRESSRLASIIGLGVNVKVVAEDGITAPDGTHFPKGCLLSVPSWGTHNDEEIYHDPTAFKPERHFSASEKTSPTTTTLVVNANTAADTPSPNPTEKSRSYLSRANQSFTSTSPTYLAFGHGRHACPGRFFAAQELKLLLAYLLGSYELRLEDRGGDGGRVRNVWMGPNHLPPLAARVGVRRRV